VRERFIESGDGPRPEKPSVDSPYFVDKLIFERYFRKCNLGDSSSGSSIDWAKHVLVLASKMNQTEVKKLGDLEDPAVRELLHRRHFIRYRLEKVEKSEDDPSDYEFRESIGFMLANKTDEENLPAEDSDIAYIRFFRPVGTIIDKNIDIKEVQNWFDSIDEAWVEYFHKTLNGYEVTKSHIIVPPQETTFRELKKFITELPITKLPKNIRDMELVIDRDIK